MAPSEVTWRAEKPGQPDGGEAPESGDPPRDERILIISDRRLSRENLAAALVLNGFPQPRIAWDLPSLVVALANADLRIVLLDMTTRGSRQLLRAAVGINPNLRAVALAVSDDDESAILACDQTGVIGYHMRSGSLEELIALIHAVASGTSSRPATIAAILWRRLSAHVAAPSHDGRGPVLTARENQILRLLELGWSNRAIAAEIGIAVSTVKNHVHNLLSKLGVGTRAQAAAVSRAMRVDGESNRQI